MSSSITLSMSSCGKRADVWEDDIGGSSEGGSRRELNMILRSVRRAGRNRPAIRNTTFGGGRLIADPVSSRGVHVMSVGLHSGLLLNRVGWGF